MRTTSLPPALTVAAAALAVAVLLPLALPSSAPAQRPARPAPAERWLRPVPGEVARSFSYVRAAPFVAGAHRGVDLAAAPGAPVRSACAGVVVHAGPVARAGRVVSVRCHARRVSYLPLARIAVRTGAAIRAGAPIGTVAAGHGGLHLGVRRESDRFGYEDPLALLAHPRHAPQPPSVARPPRRAPGPLAAEPRRVPGPLTAPRLPPASPVVVPRAAPGGHVSRAAPGNRVPRGAPGGHVPRAAPTRRVPPGAPDHPAPRPPGVANATHPPRSPRGIAPWPVWAGLALLLAGAAGSGTAIAIRRRTAPAPAPATNLGRAR